jgi:ElaB/YqjD/DUF883 family membrane-anchored ribosome-binding protein
MAVEDNTATGRDAYVSARAAQAAHEAIDNISQRSAEAEQRLRAASGKASARSQEIADDVVAYVNKNPLASIGMAAAAGFVLGALFRR